MKIPLKNKTLQSAEAPGEASNRIDGVSEYAKQQAERLSTDNWKQRTDFQTGIFE